MIRFRTAFVLDATDLGDMLVFTATAYALGQESQAQTGEPSAPGHPDPACIQNFTFPLAVEYRPGEDHTISKPDGYDQNRTTQPYTMVYRPYDPASPAYQMFATAPGTMGPFWTYRRALDVTNFDDPRIPFDVSILNWTGNDFRGGPVVDRPPDEQQMRYQEARLLSLGFLYWLQTEAPRDDGGSGYPELNPRPGHHGQRRRPVAGAVRAGGPAAAGALHDRRAGHRRSLESRRPGGAVRRHGRHRLLSDGPARLRRAHDRHQYETVSDPARRAGAGAHARTSCPPRRTSARPT